MNGLKDFSKIVNNYKALIVLIIAGKVLISIAFRKWLSLLGKWSGSKSDLRELFLVLV